MDLFWHMCNEINVFGPLGHSHYILCLTDPDSGFRKMSEEIKKKIRLLAHVGEIVKGKVLFISFLQDIRRFHTT